MKAIISKHEAREIVLERILKSIKDMKFEGAGVSAMNVKLLDEVKQRVHDQLEQNLIFLRNQK